MGTGREQNDFILRCTRCGDGVVPFKFKYGVLICSNCTSQLDHNEVTVERSDNIVGPFLGQYFIYSNFFPVVVVFDYFGYWSIEHAYQAAKTLDPAERMKISDAKKPGKAKSLGRLVELRPDWEEVKFSIMEELVRYKFVKYPPFGKMLLETGDKHIEEINTWGDRVWGTVNGVGENNLGKILMKIRGEL